MKTPSKTVHVRWVRSGIGFPRRQRQMVRSLGLRRLGQVKELEDSPCVRGLLAAVPHLVEVAKPQAKPGWKSVPEYAIVSLPPVLEQPSASDSAQGKE